MLFFLKKSTHDSKKTGRTVTNVTKHCLQMLELKIMISTVFKKMLFYAY